METSRTTVPSRPCGRAFSACSLANMFSIAKSTWVRLLKSLALRIRFPSCPSRSTQPANTSWPRVPASTCTLSAETRKKSCWPVVRCIPARFSSTTTLISTQPASRSKSLLAKTSTRPSRPTSPRPSACRTTTPPNRRKPTLKSAAPRISDAPVAPRHVSRQPA